MKTNTLPLPMQYKILKKLLGDQEFTFEVSVRSTDVISFKVYLFTKQDADSGDIQSKLISADSFINLLNKIENEYN